MYSNRQMTIDLLKLIFDVRNSDKLELISDITDTVRDSKDFKLNNKITKLYQKENNLVVDGIIGKKTKLKLQLDLSSYEIAKFKVESIDTQSGTKSLIPLTINGYLNRAFIAKPHEYSATTLNKEFGYASRTPTLIRVPVPKELGMVAAWNSNLPITNIRFHPLVAEALKNVLTDIVDTFTKDEVVSLGLDQYGGAFNYRAVRGGTKLSTHSWGVSIDINPLGAPMGKAFKSTVFKEFPELAEKYFNIMYKHGFRTLSSDLMHWMYTV